MKVNKQLALAVAAQLRTRQNQIIPKSIARACSSSSSYRRPTNYNNGEPEPLVVNDIYKMDYSELKIPFLTDARKQEIYQLHKSNPIEWDVNALSVKYWANKSRIEAVLLLMAEREKVKENEWKKIEQLATKDECESIYKGFLDLYNPEKKRLNEERPKSKQKEDTRPPLLPEHAPLIEKLQEEKFHDKTLKVLTRIIDHMHKDATRMANVAAHEKAVIDVLQEMQKGGVKQALNFQESPYSGQDNSGNHGSSFEDRYFPELFGDEQYEQKMADLMLKLTRDTKSRPTENMERYLKRFELKKELEGKLYDKNNYVDTNRPSDPKKYSRWKWAFRDLSHFKGKDKKKSPLHKEVLMDERTVIVTRKGQLRPATPLEEAFRSWTKHPKELDLYTNRGKIAKYKNFDGDDDMTEKLRVEKFNRHKRIKDQKAAEGS